MLVRASIMEKPSKEDDKSMAHENTTGNPIQDLGILEGGARIISKVFEDPSARAYEANAEEERARSDDPLAVVHTSLQKKQHQTLDHMYTVVRAASAMWLFLWIWW